MKKFLSILLAVVLMMTLSVSAFAAISPGAGVVPPQDGGSPGLNGDGEYPGGNVSPDSPPTGYSIVLLATAAAASLASAGVAVKKLSEKD